MHPFGFVFAVVTGVVISPFVRKLAQRIAPSVGATDETVSVENARAASTTSSAKKRGRKGATSARAANLS